MGNLLQFLLGTGALWAMTALCVAQTAAGLYARQYPMALIMAAYAFADIGLIWNINAETY